MEILELVVKLLAAAAAGLFAWVAPKLRSWLIARAGQESAQEILSLATTFAQAAEQLLKEEDPTGEKRKRYVLEHLEQLGIEVTEAVVAMVESAVWSINASRSA